MEDGSSEPDGSEQHVLSGPPAAELHAENNVGDTQPRAHEGAEVVEVSPAATEEYNNPAAAAAHHRAGVVEGNNVEVGHEVSPTRGTPAARDVGYYAHLHLDDENLADNVASDVRRVQSPLRQHSGEGLGEVGSLHGPPDYEDVVTPEDAAGHGEQRNAQVEVEDVDVVGGEDLSVDGPVRPHRHPSAVTGHSAVTATTTVTARTTTTALMRQPCHGTQVEADADLSTTTERPTCNTHAEGVTAVVAPAGAPLPPVATGGAGIAAPPRWSLLPQAAHGTAEVTVTLLPMQALTRITVPVHNPNFYRPPHPPASNSVNSESALGIEGHGGVAGDWCMLRDTGASANASTVTTAPYWVLVAKELFEVLAEHLSLHPESFHIFHQHKRLRFMGTLFLDCDVTSPLSPTNPASAGAAAGPIENNRAEPVWVSVTFPGPQASAAAAAATASESSAREHPLRPFTAAAADGAEDEAAEAQQVSLSNVPQHLAGLGPGDYVARCIRVRRRKIQVPPRTLVEGRRQGYSYDEVIQQMQSLHDAAALKEGKEGGGSNTNANLDGRGASNFTMVAVVQDSPAPPAKPFLGGYRDKRLAGHVLLHAATQLYHRDLEYSPFAKWGNNGAGAADRVSRQTQTFGISRSCQTHREACAQTPRADLMLDASHDFVVVARPYFTAAAVQGLREEMAVVIQKLYRQWKARRVRAALEAAEAVRQHRAGARQRREEALHAAVEDAAQLRRNDPRSAVDFERVKQDVIAWRAEEAARIQNDPTLSAADARVALLAITKKELQLLQQLDQRRREVCKTREEAAFVHNLDRMAAPKQWGIAHVVTPETERAGELRDLYERLVQTIGAPSRSTRGGTVLAGAASNISSVRNNNTASKASKTMSSASSPSHGLQGSSSAAGSLQGENTVTLAATSAEDGLTSTTAARLDILLRVKWTVKEFNAGSALARELAELIDREADLLHRGRKDASLSGLRKRIQTLFAQFIEDPEYNPGVRDFVQTARGRARVKAVEAEKAQQQSRSQKTRA